MFYFTGRYKQHRTAGSFLPLDWFTPICTFYSGSLSHPESNSLNPLFPGAASWELLINAQWMRFGAIQSWKWGQKKISCAWCCCFTYEEFGSRDRLWIYFQIAALIWKVFLLVLKTPTCQLKSLKLTNGVGSIFSRDIAPSVGGRCFKHFPKNKNEENCILIGVIHQCSG